MSFKIADVAGGVKKERTLPKAGPQMARLIHIVDLGVQELKPYKGEQKPPARQFWFNFELPNDKMEIDGKMVPQRLGTKFFNAFNDPKAAIIKFINSLDPANKFNGDLEKFLNIPCMVTVVHAKYSNAEGNEIPVANFGGAMPMPDGFPEVPQLTEAPALFKFDDPTVESWKSIPVFIQDKIKKSIKYSGSKVEKLVNSLGESTSAVADADTEDAPY